MCARAWWPMWQRLLDVCLAQLNFTWGLAHHVVCPADCIAVRRQCPCPTRQLSGRSKGLPQLGDYLPLPAWHVQEPSLVVGSMSEYVVCVGALPLAGWMAAQVGSPSLGDVSQMLACGDVPSAHDQHTVCLLCRMCCAECLS